MILHTEDHFFCMQAAHKFSDLTFYVLALLLCWLVLFYPPNNVFAYDVFGYYLYLPLGFKYSDLTIQDMDIIRGIMAQYKPSETFYQAIEWENGNFVMRYPIGMAVLYAPFYFIGDIWARLSDMPADGFSRPYQLSVLFGCLMYSVAGLYFLKKILQKYFSDMSAAITLAAVVLGTNYLFHTSVHGQGAMSHNPLFTLYVLILWLSILWHEQRQRKHLLWLGVCVGLAALCRATEIMVLLIPFLFGVSHWRSFKEKISLFWQYKKDVMLFGLVTMGIGSIQLLYYKYAAGKFIINTYGASNPGEGLELFHPHLAEVFFSFRKGIFVYTPLLLFAVFGLYQLYKKHREFFLPVLCVSFGGIYIVASWSNWWFGSCFGIRALIPSLALLSLPLASFTETVLSSSRIKQFALGIVFILLIFLSLFQSWQLSAGILDGANMSRAYYFSTFLQTTSPTPQQKELLLKGKSNSLYEPFTKHDSLTHSLGFARWQNFEDALPDSLKTSTDRSRSGRRSLKISVNESRNFILEESVENITDRSYTMIKASAWIYSDVELSGLTAYFNIFMRHKGWIFKWAQYKITAKNFEKGKWNKLEYYYMVPDDLRSRKDKVCIEFENRTPGIIYLDDVLMESWHPVIDRSVF